MRREAKPYIVPDVSSVRLHPWERYEGDQWVDLGSEVEGWDPDTDILLRRTVEADWNAIRGQAGLPLDFPLVLTAGWSASTSQMRAAIARVKVPAGGIVAIEGVIRGTKASGVLELITTLATAVDWPAAPIGVARRAGSTFLVENNRVTLEGSGSLFPVAILDFAHSRLHPEASWHLSAPQDLNAPFMGTFLLSINQRDTELVEAITAAKPLPAQRLLVQEVHHQVAMMMLELSIEAEQNDDLLNTDWPAESAGEVLKFVRLRVSGMPPSDSAERRTWLAGSSRRGANGRAFR
ncbi:hypothetical protein ACPPVT_00095 [Angustibacter sp. McL0619]|uniref:hypothetical protein n=1 Tax=Angustibacter sp. McL0619 TaxID=3415676 RepID=UPI003CED1E17